MPLINVPTGGLARSIHVQQIIKLLRGDPASSEPVSFTGISSPSGFSLTVANLDGVLGRGLRVYNSTLSIPLLDVAHAGTKVRANADGGTYIFDVRKADDTSVFRVTDAGATVGGATLVTLTGTENLTNKTLTSPILNAAKVNNYLDIIKQVAAPATPGAGHIFFYGTNADEFLHYKESATGTDKILVDTNTTGQIITNKTITSSNLTTPVITDYATLSQGTAPGTPGATSLFAYFLNSTNDLRYKAGNSTERIVVDTTSTQALAGKILTTPTLNGGFINDYADLNITTAPATPGASHLFLYGKTGTNDLRFKAAGSGTEHIIIDDATAQTLAAKIMTTPVLNGPVIGTGLNTDSYADFKQAATAAGAPGAGIIRAYTKTGSTSMWVRTNASGELELVDTTSAQTISGKTFGTVSLTGPTLANPLITNYQDFTQSASTPGTPGASKMRLWAKTDNNAYMNVGGIDQTILTSANTSLSAAAGLARPMILGTL